jgi:cysteine synthase B
MKRQRGRLQRTRATRPAQPEQAAGASGRSKKEGVIVIPATSVLDLIGNTPMLDVSNLSPNPNVRIIAKLESQNPFGSVKDRIAKNMIEQAEKEGLLTPGQTIIEPSSGNTGIALAAIAQLKGYPIKILMPNSVSIERRQMLEVFGAELILTPGEEGSNGAVRRAQEMAAEHPEWCFLYQYGNDNNPMAHYEGTGPEIFRDCPEITHFVAGLGTSGTLMGTGRYLKEQKPGVKIIAIEPPLGERVEGLRNLDDGYIPPVFEQWYGFDLLDRKRVVRPRESLEWTRRLVAECGVFAGISSGAALAGAAKVASEIDEGTIVFIVCDGGWKYLSTGAYTDDLDEAEKKAEQIIYF